MIAFVGGKIGEHLQREPAKRLFPRWALAIQEENHWHFKFDIKYKFTFILFKVMAHFRSNEAALSFFIFLFKIYIWLVFESTFKQSELHSFGQGLMKYEKI